MHNEIVAGIIAGILTSVIIWIIVKLVNNVILPWYESKTFKGVKLNGTWTHTHSHTKDSELFKYEDKLMIYQKGYTISGTYTCRNERHGEILTTEYSMIGHIQDSYVLINYQRKNNVGTGIGSFLLKIIGNSDQLCGGVSFIELKTTDVISYGNIIFRKQ